MCRLFAIISSEEVGAEFHDLMRPFQKQAVEHPHGWGIGWYEEGKARLFKKPVSAYQNPEFLYTADGVHSKIIIAHIRNSSASGHTEENTHPFLHDRWLFAHNGSMDTANELKRMLPERYLERLKGQTDSEICFQWILYNVDESKSVEKGIRKAVQYIKEKKGPESSAMNFLLANGRELFVYRCAFKRESYYALHFLQKEDTVIVSSDPLTDESWVPISNAQLLTIDKQLQISSISI